LVMVLSASVFAVTQIIMTAKYMQILFTWP
jgi:hypothetical protein